MKRILHTHARPLMYLPLTIRKGYHVPAVRHRDAFYQKLEDDRAAALGQK